MKITVGDSRLSPIEFQTLLFEAANLCNERPIGVSKNDQSDRTFEILMPNCLIMGQAENGPMVEEFLDNKLTKAEHFKLVQDVIPNF